MIPQLFLASSLISAGGSLLGGIGAKKSAELAAYNVETQRILGEAEARARSNQRMEEYRANLSANIASFAAAGRDIGGMDRSVKAFLDKQREIAFTDVARSEFMSEQESARLRAEAAATRREGKARAVSGAIGAFTTIAGGLYDYNQIRIGSGGSGGSTSSLSSFAPTTSLRPRARPTGG